MKTISLTCPNCNANLEISNTNNGQCYCQYCGTKILIDDGRKIHETHFFNENGLKRTEMKEKLKIREMEIREQQRNESRETGKKLLIVAGIIAVIGLIFKMVDLSSPIGTGILVVAAIIGGVGLMEIL